MDWTTLILAILQAIPLKRGVSKLLVRRAKKILEKVEKSRPDLNLYGFLKWKYGGNGYEILERCGYIYPVAVFRAPAIQQSDVNSIVGKFNANSKPSNESLVFSPAYRRIMKAFVSQLDQQSRDSALYNGLSYTMSRIRSSVKELKVDCQLGSFYELLDTCYSLEWEILKSWSKKPPKDNSESSYQSFFRKLKLRYALHNRVADPVVDGSCRSAGLAISGLIAYRDHQNKLRLWVRSRSHERVALYPGFHHVIPSGQVQPLSNAEEEMTDLTKGGPKLSFYREYLEELFSKEDPNLPKPNQKSYMKSGIEWSAIYNDRRLKILLELLKDPQKAEFRLTGLMVNLFNLQPEICTLLYIKTPDWYENHSARAAQKDMEFNINGEWAQIDNYPDRARYIASMPYDENDMNMMEHGGKLYPSRFVPNGAASFWLGIDSLREILKKESAKI